MAGGVYHVWARGNRREAIFVDDDDRLAYLAELGFIARELGWQVLAYCLMSNHVHLLIELTRPNLGKGIQWLHGNHAREFNLRHGRGGGHLFEKRFGSRRTDSAGDVMYLACYVLLNPVKAELCDLPADYEWSSYGATLGDAEVPRWLAAHRLLERFGGPERFTAILEAVRILGAAGFDPGTSREWGGRSAVSLGPPAAR